jgi:ankyrin repeat protein
MNTFDLTPLPARPSLEQYKKQAKEFLHACKAGDRDALARVRKWHPRFDKLKESELQAGAFVLADTQLTLAREHGFESWPKFAKHIQELARENSPVSRFELAADAIVSGDATTLGRLLRENPVLARERSSRVHRATLLHYVGANGLENFRQKTPPNAVEIANMLVRAGAEVDAVADIYGQSATLELVASSIHPKVAGVQMALMQALLNAGAAVDGAPGTGSPLLAALRNGRAEAAEFLAEHGAHLDLEGAAGVGRLDVVQSFFTDAGALRPEATQAQMETGFLWACEYGRNNVVEFLLDKGVDMRTKANTGLTGLHWAIVGGQLATVHFLIKRGAPLEERNAYGGTALGQAVWSASNNTDPTVDCVPIIRVLMAAGADVNAYPELRKHVEELLRQ